jgi:hypothetical protein
MKDKPGGISSPAHSHIKAYSRINKGWLKKRRSQTCSMASSLV